MSNQALEWNLLKVWLSSIPIFPDGGINLTRGCQNKCGSKSECLNKWFVKELLLYAS